MGHLIKNQGTAFINLTIYYGPEPEEPPIYEGFRALLELLEAPRHEGMIPRFKLRAEKPRSEDRAMEVNPADPKLEALRTELKTFGFVFDSEGRHVSWNGSEKWKPMTKWVPKSKEEALDIKPLGELPSIEIESMVPFTKSTRQLFLAMADIGGHRQPVVIKEYKKDAYYAMAFVPGTSFTGSGGKFIDAEVEKNQGLIDRYFVNRKLDLPEEFIYTGEAEIPIDPETLRFMDGTEIPGGEPTKAYVLSQLGGPTFYGLVTLKTGEAGDKASLAQKGGIDLTPAKMDLQVKKGIASSLESAPRNDTGITFHLDPAMLAQLQKAPGFVPVIISVQPLRDLQGFLGVQNNSTPQASAVM